ncbi:MAG: EAL domain-containing protein [Curvibacter lanceolatus]|uniref:EAL domain-containing protein n=1 Tax=Curvibacter lanceolatus TaxID=86182 RepID=UPI0023524866|nr:EAL domain-containing protein [Curvibacter lanceolatus]MBV5293317.1 EAL domain-containing protein [Curvibacter lanceolatus]
MAVIMGSTQLGISRGAGYFPLLNKIVRAGLLKLNLDSYSVQVFVALSTLVISFSIVLSAVAFMVYSEIKSMHAIKLKLLDDFVQELDRVYGLVQASMSASCSPQNLERLHEVVLTHPSIVHIGLGFSGQGMACTTLTGPLENAVKISSDQYSLPLGGYISSLPVQALLTHVGFALHFVVLQRGDIYLFMDEARFAHLFGVSHFEVLGHHLMLGTRVEGRHHGWVEKSENGVSALKSSLHWAAGTFEITSRLDQPDDEIRLSSTISPLVLLTAGEGRCLGSILLLSGVLAALVFACLRCLMMRVDSIDFYIRHLCTLNDVHCFYQPIVHVGDGRVLGCEVLTRIARRSGYVMPDEFIPVLVKNGLQKGYDEMVCHRVRQEMASISDLPAGFHVHINLFAQSLDAQRIEDLRQGIGEQITWVIEVAEDQLSEAGLLNLLKLKSVRFLVSVNDFSAEFFSLGVLREISPNYLKIGKSPIFCLQDSSVVASRLPEILGVSKAIACELIAEGVETEAQLEKIKSLHIPYAQGCLFARPLALNDFYEYLWMQDSLQHCSVY